MLAIWQPCTVFVKVAPLGLAISNPLPLNLHTFHPPVPLAEREPPLSERQKLTESDRKNLLLSDARPQPTTLPQVAVASER